MNLGKNILELRKTQNITQDALAAELGVTAAAVSKWENNYTLPDVLMLCALADFFQVSTDTLLGRDPKPFCAAIATSSLPLAEQIRELLQKRSFLVKHMVYGSFADAMEAISKILTKEVKSDHIGVCSVYPGGVDTNFRAVANHSYLKPETVAKMIRHCIEVEEGCVHDIVIRPFIEDNLP